MATVTVRRFLWRLLLTALATGVLGCLLATSFLPLFSLEKEVGLSTAPASLFSARNTFHDPSVVTPPLHRDGNALATTDAHGLLHGEGGEAAAVTGYVWLAMEQLLWITRIHTVLPNIPSRVKPAELYKDIPQLVSDFRMLQYLDVAATLATGLTVLLGMVWVGAMLLVLVKQRCGNDRGDETNPTQALSALGTTPEAGVVANPLDDALDRMERGFLRTSFNVFTSASLLTLVLAWRTLILVYSTRYYTDSQGGSLSGNERGNLKHGEDCDPLKGCISSFSEMGFTKGKGWWCLVAATGLMGTSCLCQLLVVLGACLQKVVRRSAGARTEDEYGLLATEDPAMISTS